VPRAQFRKVYWQRKKPVLDGNKPKPFPEWLVARFEREIHRVSRTQVDLSFVPLILKITTRLGYSKIIEPYTL
jgi:hypothetical protein